MRPLAPAAALSLAGALALAGCGSRGGSPDGLRGAVTAQAAAASTASGGRLALALPGTRPSVGDTVEVEVTLDAAAVHAAGFELVYDPAALEFLSADATGGSMAGAFAVSALRRGRPGRLVFGVSLEGPRPGRPAAGRLAVVRLRALRPGDTTLALAAAHATDARGLELRLPAIPTGTLRIQ
ncbi:MAG: hypothetical protein HY722_04890 [Planctomycetes bacterium]|nr:hypothetical protein [Planctomycetota bacterium]